jgi:DNA-binding XRE family transcriptional regulator
MKQRDYETLRQHLATNLKSFRREHALSQERLSLEADVDRTYVSQIERTFANCCLLHSHANAQSEEVLACPFFSP